MKYKVGDMVRPLSISYADKEEEKRFIGKTAPIIDIWEDNKEGFYYGLENGNWGNIYFKDDELEDMRRDYVVICMGHKVIINGALLFLGSITENDEERNLNGYTIDIEKCERFTFDEVNKHGFDVIKSSNEVIPDNGYFAIKIDDLLQHGFNKYTVMHKKI